MTIPKKRLEVSIFESMYPSFISLKSTLSEICADDVQKGYTG